MQATILIRSAGRKEFHLRFKPYGRGHVPILNNISTIHLQEILAALVLMTESERSIEAAQVVVDIECGNPLNMEMDALGAPLSSYVVRKGIEAQENGVKIRMARLLERLTEEEMVAPRAAAPAANEIPLTEEEWEEIIALEERGVLQKGFTKREEDIKAMPNAAREFIASVKLEHQQRGGKAEEEEERRRRAKAEANAMMEHQKHSSPLRQSPEEIDKTQRTVLLNQLNNNRKPKDWYKQEDIERNGWPIEALKIIEGWAHGWYGELPRIAAQQPAPAAAALPETQLPPSETDTGSAAAATQPFASQP